MTPKKNRPSAYHHGQLKASLIKHALTIIETEGIKGLTLRKAARRAGVSHAAPAHHFGDMKGLLAALAQEGFYKMTKTMEQAIQHIENDNPLGKLKCIGITYIEFAVHHPAYFNVMHHPELALKASHPGLEQESKNTFDIVKTIIKECQDANIIAPGNILHLSLFVWSTVHGFATLVVDRQLEAKGLKEDIMQYADLITLLIYTGVKDSNLKPQN